MVSLLNPSGPAGRFARKAAKYDWLDILSVSSSSLPIRVKRSSASPLFMYADASSQARRDISSPLFPQQPEIVVLTPEELLRECKNQKKNDNNRNKEKYYHYYTSPVSDICPSQLERGSTLSDWQELLLSDNSEQNSGGRSAGGFFGSHPSLWIGGPGSTTQAHYDVADNVLIQLSGRKRIRCWSPKEHFSMHVFPDSHPRARKAQIPIDLNENYKGGPAASNNNTNIIDDEALSKFFPLRSTLMDPCLDVILNPGDGLRIDAFWFHHVEALDGHGDVSVSLNVFSGSPILAIAAHCLGTPLPSIFLSSDDNDSIRIRKLIKLWQEVEAEFLMDQPDFIPKLWMSRFQPLQNYHNNPNSLDISELAKRLEDHDDDLFCSTSSTNDTGLEATLANLRILKDALSQQQKAARGNGEDIMGIVLGHLLESWIVRVWGDSNLVGPIIHAMSPDSR